MKVDDDEIRGRGRPSEARIGRLEWFGIITLSVLIGGLLHDGARMLIANAWTNYQLQQLDKELRKMNQQMSDRRLAQENTRLRMQLEIERVRKQNSTECQFWLKQHQVHPSDRTAKEVKVNCPQ